MPYVRRDAAGLIQSLHRDATDGAPEFPSHGAPEAHGALEFLRDDAAEVQAFVGNPAPPTASNASDFGRLDADFVRVLEDVIDTLIVKNVLNITDLPEQAQAKLFARKSFRERVSKSALQLFEPSRFGDVI